MRSSVTSIMRTPSSGAASRGRASGTRRGSNGRRTRGDARHRESRGARGGSAYAARPGRVRRHISSIHLVRRAAHRRCWVRPSARITTTTVRAPPPKYQFPIGNIGNFYPDMELSAIGHPAGDPRAADSRDRRRTATRASLCGHADVATVPAHAARRPGRRRHRQPPAAAAGRLHPPGGQRHLRLAARSAGGSWPASSAIVREEMDATGAQEVILPDRAAARALGAQRAATQTYGPADVPAARTARTRSSACRRPPRR